jgi:hypothetical protein
VSLAEAQPLVLGFEDLHWAEDPLLDLVEHLADRIDDAPVLIVCLARPELLEARPGWGGGRRRAISIDLAPLADDEAEQLVDGLVDGAGLPAGLRSALLEKTEGNPLFVEETVRMLAEHRDGGAVRIPDTIQALIASRIDRLPPASRSVVRHGALVGRVFWRGAVAELDPALDVDSALEDLVDRQLLTREPLSTISGETAFRFRHILIRDVAYSGLAKGERARLHRAFADWLRSRSADELVEAQAFHLDRAAALLAELDGQVPADLRAEAADVLERAGCRALAREANRTARRLLLRSIELEPSLERRFHAARAAWRLWELPAAEDEMRRYARSPGPPASARSKGWRSPSSRRSSSIATPTSSRADARSRGARPARRRPGDARSDALTLLSSIGWWEGDLEGVERYTGEALEIAREANRPISRASRWASSQRPTSRDSSSRGPTRCSTRRRALAESSGSLSATAWVARIRGSIHLRRSRFADAEREFHAARDLFDEIGAASDAGRTQQLEGLAVWQGGDPDRAEQIVRRPFARSSRSRSARR